MDEKAVSHLSSGVFDVACFSDHSQIELSIEEFQPYSDLHVIAWSLGVFAAEHYLSNTSLKIRSALAINGTIQAIDDNSGIPENVFLNTLKNWDERNRTKFEMRMFGGRQNWSNANAMLPNRATNNQKEELAALLQLFNNDKPRKLKWDHVIVGRQDLIFPYDSQKNFWETRAHIKELDIPHFPFIVFNSWEQLMAI